MGSLETAHLQQVRALQVDDIPNCATNDQLVLELVTDDDVDLDQLALVIEESPSLVAMIIGLANSAYFSAPTPIHTISDAIIKVLGIRMVRSIVLSVILGRSLDLTRCPNFSPVDYWADSLTTARFCQMLTSNSDFKKLVSVDQVYLSALLANFGQLVLVHHYPTEMNEIIEDCERQLSAQIQKQAEVLGIDQGEAGVLLGRAWSLPNMVVNTMHHCHDPDYEGQDWAVTLLVGEISRIVNQVSLGTTDLALSPRCLKLLNISLEDCRLEEVIELREDLFAIASLLQADR